MEDQNNLKLEKKSIKQQLVDGLVIVLSFVHLTLLFIVVSPTYQILFGHQEGLDIIMAIIIGGPVLVLSAAIAIIIFYKKRNNLFNKISAIITLSGVGLIIIISLVLFFISIASKFL